MLRLDNTKKILLIRLSSLGDVILTTPLLRSLKKQYPRLIIDFCVREDFADVLRHNPNISNLILYRKDDSTIRNIKTSIAGSGYDLIIDLQNNYRSKFILTGLNTTILNFRKNIFLKLLLVKFKINLLTGKQGIPQRYAKVLHGFELDNDGLEIFSPDSVNADIPDADNYIGICPGSLHFTKTWPYSYYIELGEVIKLHGYKLLVFGGKREMHLCKTIADAVPGTINLCNNDDLYKTIVNMKKCKAVITNDSGLMHVASALKLPVLAIFGSSVKEFGFTPYKTNYTIIENRSLKCRPCSHIGKSECPKKHFECMVHLSPTMVYQNLTFLFSK